MATSEKVKLEGASKYKKDLQQIAAQSKALASEMKAVQSSFDKSTSAEEKNEAITAQLNKQIKKQQEYVDMLALAYKEEVAASGEQSKAAANAKDALNKAQTALNTMQRENEELATAENEETVAMERNTNARQRWNTAAKAAGVAAAAIATAVAAAAKALWDATTASGEWADQMLTLSAQTGVNTDTLQKWAYASRFIDVDMETMARGLAKATKAQGSAIKSGKEYVETLDGQQIMLKNSNGELKGAEEIFMEMVDSLGQIGDEAMRDAAAQELFGKSFQELKPLIDAGSEGLNQLGAEAEAAGLILSGDVVQQFGAFDDTMQRFAATMEVAGKQLALSFLPATQAVADELAELAMTVTTALADGFQEADVQTILDALFSKISKGMANLTAIMPAISAFITGLVTKLVQFVTENLPALVQTGLEIILGLVNGISQNLPVLIPALVECILMIVNTLMAPENIAMLMDAAIALISGLGQGLIAAIPVLLQNLPQIVANIVKSLITQASKMNQAANALISQLGTGISTAMGGLVSQIKAWVQEKIIQPVKDKMSQMKAAGSSLVQGLWNGINDKFTWIKTQISRWVGNVLKFFKNLLGIHSPSTVFYGYGENMAKGLALGWTDGLGYVQSALGLTSGLSVGNFDASPHGLGGINLYIDGIKYNSDEYVDSSITNFVENMVRRSQMYGRA